MNAWYVKEGTGEKIWPLLTGTHKYEKTLFSRDHGRGIYIEAPILAYLVETENSRILYGVGCDYEKFNNPLKRYYPAYGFTTMAKS